MASIASQVSVAAGALGASHAQGAATAISALLAHFGVKPNSKRAEALVEAFWSSYQWGYESYNQG